MTTINTENKRKPEKKNVIIYTNNMEYLAYLHNSLIGSSYSSFGIDSERSSVHYKQGQRHFVKH